MKPENAAAAALNIENLSAEWAIVSDLAESARAAVKIHENAAADVRPRIIAAIGDIKSAAVDFRYAQNAYSCAMELIRAAEHMPILAIANFNGADGVRDDISAAISAAYRAVNSAENAYAAAAFDLVKMFVDFCRAVNVPEIPFECDLEHLFNVPISSAAFIVDLKLFGGFVSEPENVSQSSARYISAAVDYIRNLIGEY